MKHAIDEFNEGHYEECIEICSKEIEENRPHAIEARNLRGSLYMLRCQYQEAFEDFNHIINHNCPSSMSTVCYKNMTGDHDSNDENEEKTRDFNNRRLKSNTFIKLTALNLQNSQETDAFANYERAIEIDPNNEDIFCNRAQVYAMKNRFDESFKDFDKVLGKFIKRS